MFLILAKFYTNIIFSNTHTRITAKKNSEMWINTEFFHILSKISNRLSAGLSQITFLTSIL